MLIPRLQDAANESILPGVELDGLDVIEKLAHEPRTLVSILHLLLLHLLQDPGNDWTKWSGTQTGLYKIRRKLTGVEGNAEDHDSDADKGTPSE